MRLIDKNLLISAGSGLLLAAAFPRPDLFPLAWVGLIPLLLVMRRRPFACGLAAGIAFFAAVLYWVNIVMTTYGGLQPFFSLVAYLFLVIYLALYFAAASWLSCALEQRLNLPCLLSFPVIWVALEYLRGLLLTGFPWALLGYSQQNFPIAIQSADVTGVYGVSLLLVTVNCAFAWVVRQPRHRWAWIGFLATLLMTVSHLGYGVWSSHGDLESRAEQLRVALIQGNIEQGVKWAAEQRQATVDRYLELSWAAEAGRPQLLIWPEAATPFFLQDPSPLGNQVRRFAARSGSYLLVGSPAYEEDGGQQRLFNSAFLFSPSGQVLGRSDKIHLVPFGEYVPLGPLLGFINKLVVGVGDFSPGHVNPLKLNGYSLGVLICYEGIFPELARDYVRQGSSLLVNITNDAWFGRSSAPYQHLAMTRFRAIENRIWLARVANTGISALIAPSGRIVSSTPLFESLQLSGVVGLGATPTFYTRYGDLLPFACLALSGLYLILFWRASRKPA